MNIKELIALADIYGAKSYSNMVKTDYGVIFYDENNPTMHDSNHACILDDTAFETALEEIKRFYVSKGLESRIYLLNGQKEKFQPLLTKSGFKVYSIGRFQYFLLTDENKIPFSNNLEIRELTGEADVTEQLISNIYYEYRESDPDTFDRSRHLIKNCINDKACHVYVGYFENEPVCIAMTVDTDYHLRCFDMVETGKQFQNRGFARELISYMVSKCDVPTFLYSENPVAIRMYKQAGFTEIYAGSGWRAVHESD